MNNIILIAYCFGSIHLFSTTLFLINKSNMRKKIPFGLNILNGTIIILSGFSITYIFSKLKKIT